MNHFALLMILTLFFSCNETTTTKADGQSSSDTSSITLEYSSLFCPQQGEAAFSKMYNLIRSAQSEVKVTVYSWSDTGFDRALEDTIKKGTQMSVKVVLHPDLMDAPHIERINKLEKLTCATCGKIQFKVAPQNMHEKFVIIDNTNVVNSSANLSGGAKTKYSENFVFLNGPKSIINSFQKEFTVLWNVSKDVISGEDDALALALNSEEALVEAESDITFYSSSMNFNYVDNDPSSAAYKQGQYKKMVPIVKEGGQTWTVKDQIIKAINEADESIFCSLNHFNIKEVAMALVEAVKRGVDVRMTVDNQEYKSSFRPPRMIEMTPLFVQEWKKLRNNQIPPVRVKYYSHNPDPSYWMLNHHKFILIDYNKVSKGPKSVLFSGSYNISRNAEHNQFDNMVIYRGLKYHDLHGSFLGEFDHLWNLQRDPNTDQPNQVGQDILNSFVTVVNGSLPIHFFGKAVALTWPEIEKLRAEVNQVAPGMLMMLDKSNSNCMNYDIAKKTLSGGANCPAAVE